MMSSFGVDLKALTLLSPILLPLMLICYWLLRSEHSI